MSKYINPYRISDLEKCCPLDKLGEKERKIIHRLQNIDTFFKEYPEIDHINFSCEAENGMRYWVEALTKGRMTNIRSDQGNIWIFFDVHR